MNRLLQKPLKLYILYALVVLACSVPVYYYIINSIWESELDEHNQLAAEFARSRLGYVNLSEQELSGLLSFWNKLKPGVLIEPTDLQTFPKDSVYTIMRTDKHVSYEPVDNFRGLISYLYIHNRPYRLTIETNSEELAPALKVIATTTSVFFLILVIGFILLNHFLSLRIWKPFGQTLSNLKEFDLHSEKIPQFTASDILEFEELNQVVTKLMKRSVATFQSQKEFTENASHELQTPLAIMQSKLELLLQGSELSKRQHTLIQEAYRALNRAARINKNLLILAKIDNSQFDATEKINLDREVEDVLLTIADHISQKGLQLHTDIQQGITVQMNRALAQMLIQNLVFNAYKYSLAGATLGITLNRHQLQISNSGNEPLHVNQLFKRFSSASKDEGTGLGLAIVHQICVHYGWKITYTFTEDRHVFVVTLLD